MEETGHLATLGSGTSGPGIADSLERKRHFYETFCEHVRVGVYGDWRSRATREIGGLVPLRVVIARTSDTAVILGNLCAYSNGFAFDLAVLLREGVAAEPDWGRAVYSPMLRQARTPPTEITWGVRWPTGSEATNNDDRAWRRTASPPVPCLFIGGGHGGQHMHVAQARVWPLPDDGPIEFFLEWQDRGVYGRVIVDNAPILAASGDAIPLWDESS